MIFVLTEMEELKAWEDGRLRVAIIDFPSEE